MQTAACKQQARQADEEEAGADKSSETTGGSVGFNAAKRAWQLSAAKSAAQVQSILSQLSQDLSDCESGAKNGRCDAEEVAEVEAMLDRAKQRLNEVSRTSGEVNEEGFDAFPIASLM